MSMDISQLNEEERFSFIKGRVTDAAVRFNAQNPRDADYLLLADDLRRILRLIEETE